MADIRIPQKDILALNLEPIQILVQSLLLEEQLADSEQKYRLMIDFPLDETDPRELSEIPEIRLWFVRLDALFPWFLFLLDWKAGELARYTAMLVPHQFHRHLGPAPRRTAQVDHRHARLDQPVFLLDEVECLGLLGIGNPPLLVDDNGGYD